jgi:hypothetical protein
LVRRGRGAVERVGRDAHVAQDLGGATRSFPRRAVAVAPGAVLARCVCIALRAIRSPLVGHAVAAGLARRRLLVLPRRLGSIVRRRRSLVARVLLGRALLVRVIIVAVVVGRHRNGPTLQDGEGRWTFDASSVAVGAAAVLVKFAQHARVTPAIRPALVTGPAKLFLLA